MTLAAVKPSADEAARDRADGVNTPRTAWPRYVLITPARNEAQFIEKTIQSVIQQIVPPQKWVIVDDGSTDETAEIVSRYLPGHPWMELVRRPHRKERNFAGKVHSFNAGLERVRDIPWEIVGNLDADISFGPDHFAFLLEKVVADPKLGVFGTTFREDGFDLEADVFEWSTHVGGQCQLFRRECFEAIGGYVPSPAGGIDWVAVISARSKGWTTRSFSERQFVHYRPMGTAEGGRLASAYRYGRKDYCVGNHPVWEFARVIRRLGRRPYFIAGMVLAFGYGWAWVRRAPRAMSPDLVRFHRREQMEKLRTFLRLRFQSLNPARSAPRD